MAHRTLLLFITVCSALIAARAQAAAKTWVGSDGGSYNTPTNWDPSGTPGTADSILFANGVVASPYDIDFDVDSTVTQLTVATNPLAFAGATRTLSLTSSLIIGRTGSGPENALLSTSLAQLNTPYVGLGGDTGTIGTLNVTAGTLNVTGSAATVDVMIGYVGTGSINV